jgi:integrase
MANTVIPVRSRDKIETIKKILSLRDRLMFIIGINSALRVSDLLTLRVGDVRDPDGKLKPEIVLREKKTGKEKRFPINEAIMKELKKFLQPDWPDDRPLFKSRKGSNNAITRKQAHEILSKAGKQIGIENLGTHSMRKTFGLHAYLQSGGNLGLVQKLLNHSSSGDTLRYIGIEQEQLNAIYLNLNL